MNIKMIVRPSIRSLVLFSFFYLILAQTFVFAGFSDYKFTNVWDEELGINGRKLNIVLNLDNTLVVSSDTFKVETIDLGKLGKYDLMRGSTEFLVALSRLPHVEISFFSAGTEKRNRRLVTEILDLVWAKHQVLILPKVFSRNSLSHFESHPNGKKDLRVLGSGVDVSHVILVDCQPEWLLAGQEDNWIGVNSKSADPHGDKKEYFSVANKLIPVLGLIAMVVEHSERTRISPVAALKALKSDGAYDSFELISNYIYFKSGIKLIRKSEPSFELVGACDL